MASDPVLVFISTQANRGTRRTNIFEAAAKGDLKTVKHLVNKKKIGVNSKENNGRTALMQACANGRFSVIKFLLQKGANINQTDKWGYNAILWALARHVNFDIVDYLVKRKANLKIKDKENGFSPLHWAVQHGDLKLAKFLTEKGARINEKTNKGETPADLAASNNYFSVLEYFVDKIGLRYEIFDAAEKDYTNAVKYFIERKNNSANAEDENGWSVLHRAASAGSYNTVKYLVENEKVNPNANCNNRRRPLTTPLHLAAEKGRANVVPYLVDHGADKNARDLEGNTALHWATKNGHSNLVEYFVDTLKMNPNERNNSNKTLLHAACDNNNVEVARYLSEEKHLNPNARDIEGRTPLMECISQGKMNVFDYLIKQNDTNVNANLVDKAGNNAMHYAADKGYVDAVTELHNRGGNHLSRNLENESPLDIAAKAGHMETVQYLVDDFETNYDNDINEVAEKGHLGLVKYLVEIKGTSPNMTDEEGWTPAHKAADQNHMNVMKYLVENSHVDVNENNSQNEKLFTPLHVASQAGHLPMVQYLSEKGADVSARDMDNRTALHLATENGFPEIVKYFIRLKKIPINQRGGRDGDTLLHAAERSGDLEIVEYLIDEMGMNVDEQNYLGYTVLHRSLVDRKFIIFRHLLEEESADFRISNNKNQTCLHEAAKGGKIDAVKLLAEKGADVESTDMYGRTPLHYAAGSGANDNKGRHLAVLKYFIDEMGANVLQRDKLGKTLLHIASGYGPLDIVKYLIADKKLDVNAKDNEGRTPLYETITAKDKDRYVTSSEEAEIVDRPRFDVFSHLLNETSVDVQAADNSSGKTCLHEAAKMGYNDMARVLVDAGASVDSKDYYGRTPVHYAINGTSDEHSNLDMVRYLLDEEKADIDQTDGNDDTYLHTAVKKNASDVVKYLAEEKKVDVNARNAEGFTVLYISLKEGQFPLFDYLLKERSADFKIPNNSNVTCLHKAAADGYMPQVKELVEKGADVNAEEVDGRTPVFYAAAGKMGHGGYLNVLRYFLDGKKADVNQKDRSGRTLLHGAVWWGPLDVVKYLVERKGQNVNVQDNFGFTPLYEAINKDQLDVFLYLLREKSADFRISNNKNRTCLHEAAAKGHMDIVKELVDQGADIDAEDDRGETPLFAAASGSSDSGGHQEIVEYLVDEKNADILQKDRDNNILLQAAVKHGSLDVVKYLVKKKELDVDAKDINGNTALLNSISLGELGVFNYLLKEGKANSSIANDRGETPLHKAANFGLLDIVKELVNGGAKIEAKDNDGKTPVHQAALAPDDTVLRYFLNEEKANPFQEDNRNQTLLHAAVHNDVVPTVKYLVEEKGLDVNAKNSDGETPLKLATEKQNREVIEYLQSKGADLNRRRRKVPRFPDESRATNSAYRYYSVINYAANHARNIASSLLTITSEFSEATNSGAAISESSWGLSNSFLMLLNVAYGKIFGFSSTIRGYMLLSPRLLIEQRLDPNAIIAIHNYSSSFEIEN